MLYNMFLQNDIILLSMFFFLYLQYISASPPPNTKIYSITDSVFNDKPDSCTVQVYPIYTYL